MCVYAVHSFQLSVCLSVFVSVSGCVHVQARNNHFFVLVCLIRIAVLLKSAC